MKIQPAQFPYFFYGTLMDGGEYYDKIKRFQASTNTAFVMGKLYYNIFLEQKEEKEQKMVTAALDPAGVQKIQGVLFYGSQCESLELQSIVDELEFNFHLKDQKNKQDTKKDRLEDQENKQDIKRDRTYLRNLVLCTTQNGESHLAWCYLYYSKTQPLQDIDLVNESQELGVVVKYEKKTHDEYEEIIRQRKLAKFG